MTNKQRQFANEYLVDLDGTKAAIRSGYSAASAAAISARLRGKPDVKAYLDSKLAEREKKTGINADEVLRVFQEVIKIGLANGDLAAVTAANAWRGKFLNMFTEKHEVTGAAGGPLIISWEAAPK